MKRLIIIALSILVMGCNVMEEYSDHYRAEEFNGHELYYSDDFEYLSNTWEVSKYIVLSVDYNIDCGYQNPIVTLNTGLGNCTSYSIAFLNTLYYVTGEKANIILVDSGSREIVKGGFDAHHCVVELSNGSQIEPQTGQYVNYEVLYRYSFDDVF